MISKSDFLNVLEDLEVVYDELDEDNRKKLEEAVQMVLTKFKSRL